MDKPAVQPGAVLDLSVTLANPGGDRLLDVYMGAMLPPAAGPGFGCPLGDAVAFLADGLPRVVVTCLSSAAEHFAPLARAVRVPDSIPTTIIPLQSLAWPAGPPSGSYIFFLALALPGAFTAGRSDAPGVVALATAVVLCMP